MATTQISWCAAQTILNAVDMSDGDGAGANGGCFCLGSQNFPGCMVQVFADFSGGTTDNLRTQVFHSVDGTNVDTVPLTQFDLTGGADKRISFPLEHVFWFRVDCSMTGTPSDKGVVTVQVLPWEYTSA